MGKINFKILKRVKKSYENMIEINNKEKTKGI